MDTLLAVKESLIRRCDDITINPQGKEKLALLIWSEHQPNLTKDLKSVPIEGTLCGQDGFCGALSICTSSILRERRTPYPNRFLEMHPIRQTQQGIASSHDPWYTVVLLCPLCNWLWKCASSSCQKEQGQRPHDFSWSERRQGRHWRGSSACCGWPPPCSAGCPSPTVCPPGSLDSQVKFWLFLKLIGVTVRSHNSRRETNAQPV